MKYERFGVGWMVATLARGTFVRLWVEMKLGMPERRCDDGERQEYLRDPELKESRASHI